MKKVRSTPISEQPFPVNIEELGAYRERAPLLYVFRHALMGWVIRQSRVKTLIRNVGQRFLGQRLPSARPYAAECGVFQGHSLKACAQMAERMNVPVMFFGFDTFDGLPALSDTDKHVAPKNAPYLSRKLFGNTSLQEVLERTSETGVTETRLFPGLFEDAFLRIPDRRYLFVNVDCDLFDGHLQALNYFYPRMEPGGIIYFDDYHSREYPMARLAVDQFFADKPEPLWHLRLGEDNSNMTKTFIMKH